MAYQYVIKNQQGVYFITCTIRHWVDVFTRNEYKEILVSSLRYCQKEKGLMIYAWVIMTNHIHLIIGTNKENLSDIIRDFKKYSARKIVKAIEANPLESRKRWLLWLLKKENKILFWQEGYHGEEITSPAFYRTKERYIHLNPVRAGIVMKEEEYLFSSAPTRFGLIRSVIHLSDFL